MSKKNHILQDGLFAMVMLIGAFLVNLILKNLFDTQTMIPMIFVLGVFLVSWRTQGYFWGIVSSLISVLAVNWAFTYPYWAFDLISPECISSAVVMLIVSTMTGALTTRLKQQEKLKAEAEKERMRGNLLRAVSHDLRTPLTAIYGSCTALLEEYEAIVFETDHFSEYVIVDESSKIEEPVEPDDTDEPEVSDEPSNDKDSCTCNCHKGGIAGFFFKIINFFQKLFGKNKICVFGTKH